VRLPRMAASAFTTLALLLLYLLVLTRGQLWRG